MKISTNITIFGGTGDLTFRKLVPALYMMRRTGKLAPDARIVIVGRRAYTDDAYRTLARDWARQFSRLPYTEADWDAFAQSLHYYRMDIADPAAYGGLADFYAQHEIRAHLFYFAVAPTFFGTITAGLQTLPGLSGSKVVIEKPFGETLESARVLNGELERFFGAENIYRIDHYLGKEMVRNVQTIRFANPIFANAWNAQSIESIEISALEDVGVETRGGYYDEAGALRDMVQNHLFQILSILAMERPENFTSAQMHHEQLRVLRALRPVDASSLADTLVLGQYAGYREEPRVSPESTTETFAALRVFLDNDRWRGTPFYIRTGKKTGTRQTEIAITFRRSIPEAEPDVLIIKVQPTEGVYLRFNIKRPGETEETVPAKMDFCQNCILEHHINTPEAYERLLTACLRGERAWFSQWDQIELSWKFIEHLRALVAQTGLPVHPYEAGNRGPDAARALPQKFGHVWVEEDD